MAVELAAAYERIEEMKLALRALQELIESADFDEDRDLAIGMIEEQLNDFRVRL